MERNYKRIPQATVSDEKKMFIKKKVTEIALAIISFSVPLVLYLLTAPRTITAYGDSAGLITSAYFFKAAHPPGYPLFIILGKLFSLIPIDSIAFRLSIMSSVLASFNSFLVYKIMRMLKLPKIPAVVSAITISLTYSLWLYAITPEVFVLNNTIALLIIYLCGKFKQKIEEDEISNSSLPCLITFLFGLGLSNHMTIILLAPAVYYFLYKNDAFRSKEQLFKMILFLFLGLTPYVHTFLSSFSLDYPHYGNLPNLGRFIQYITRYDYGGLLSGGAKEASNPNEKYLGMFYYYLKLLLNGFTFLSVPGVLYFIYHKVTKKTSLEQVIALTSILAGIVFPLMSLSGLGETDLHSQGVAERFGLLGMLFFGIAFFAGTYYLWQKFASEKTDYLNGILIILMIIIVFGNYKKVDKSDYELAEYYAQNILGQLGENDVVFTNDDLTATSLLYFARVENEKPGLILISSGFLGNKNYQKELNKMWPDLYKTQSPYEYDIARDIIETNSQKDKNTYFVMLDDPYPLGFLANPHYFKTEGLLLTANTKTTPLELTESISENEWENYNYEGLNKSYNDPFAKLTKNNYAHRAEVNSRLLQNYGCLNCAKEELKNFSNIMPELSYDNKYLENLSAIEQPDQSTAEALLELSKERFITSYMPSMMDFHRTVWDLQRAEKIAPQNIEVIGGLGEVYEMLGLYDLAGEKYQKADQIDPSGGWEGSLVRVQKEASKLKLLKYF